MAKERPILFSGEMVRAILAGRKTQTRRVVTWRNSTVLGDVAKPYWPNLYFERAEKREKSSLVEFFCGKNAPRDVHLSVPFRHPEDAAIPLEECGWYRVRPIWEIGDHLWVRETWAPCVGGPCEPGNPVLYRADNAPEYDRLTFRPSIHMPRWASRIILELTDVRVERVQEIVAADAAAEGFGRWARGGFRDLSGRKVNPIKEMKVAWDALNAKRGFSWESNPWVWVLEFRRIENE